MTQNLWRKKLKLIYPKEAIDIVLFGSAVFDFGNSRDLDVAVIFEKIPLKKQLDYSQKIKNQLKKKFDKEVHINSFDYYSLFKSGNFAREGILFYGKSLISGKNFAERFGLKPVLRIRYKLEKLEKKEKVKFNYLLSGRGGKYGLFKKYSGKILAPGIIEISPEHEKVFLEKMKAISKNISVEKCFVAF